jgi:hypothetical protein
MLDQGPGLDEGEGVLIAPASEGAEALPVRGLGSEATPDGPELGIVEALSRRKRLRQRRRTLRRFALRIGLVVMVPVVWSYGRALTGPGSDSLQARSVEWGRENHLGPVVDRVERWWFAHHQAPVGGVPKASAGPLVIPESNTGPAGAAPPSTVGTSSTAGSGPSATAGTATGPTSAHHLEGPTPLVTPADAPVPNEGQWTPFGPTVGGVQGAYVTSIRPDAVHTSVLDAVVWIDPTVLSLRQYPGLKIPGGPWDRPAYVEPTRQASLVAAFEGGFRLADSHGGMILGHRTLQALTVGSATIAIDDNGMPNIGAWGTDITESATLDSARQNLAPIVVDGAPAPDLSTDPNRKWGFTGPANHSAVWRSGAGIRPDGSLVWVGGTGLTVQSLAETLVRAGAIRGMQLDINQEWVQMNTYSAGTDGRVHGRRLLAGMEHTDDRWLSEDTRDFIAVFARTT